MLALRLSSTSGMSLRKRPATLTKACSNCLLDISAMQIEENTAEQSLLLPKSFHGPSSEEPSGGQLSTRAGLSSIVSCLEAGAYRESSCASSKWRTSAGQGCSQSRDVQFTRAGNWRARTRSFSPTGLKHRMTCRFVRTCRQLLLFRCLRGWDYETLAVARTISTWLDSRLESFIKPVPPILYAEAENVEVSKMSASRSTSFVMNWQCKMQFILFEQTGCA